MGGKTAIALGLVAGLVAGGLIVAGVIALAPVPGVSAQSPSPAAEASGAPSASVAVTAPPSASQAPSGSQPAASASPGEPSASAVAEDFGIGKPAPALALPLMGAETVELTGLKGEPVWVYFMTTSCEPCRTELPRMAEFATRYEDTGLVILAVDVKEEEAAVQAFFDDLKIVMPVGLDTDGAAQVGWGATALPVHFWIDKDGIVREAALGGIGADAMAEGLGKILPGVTVTP
jgi:thiol-disulfide isomerase/thioredoxin